MTGMTALFGFTAWTLALVLFVVAWRGIEILRGKPASSWTRQAAIASPGIVTRADHAHQNCLENLPVFAVLVFGASLLGKSASIDAVAAWILYARIGQSLAHLAGVNHWLVLLRAGFYGVQIALFLYVLWSLAV